MGTTLKDIAAMAGVSAGTVDRALHDRGRVNPLVAERIKKIAKELGYRPNQIAKGLSRRKDNLRITIILHIRRTNTFFEDVLVGIKQGYDELVDYGVSVDIKFSADFNADDQLANIDRALEEKTNGIIIVPICDERISARLEDVARSGIPVVFLTNLIEGVSYSSFVGCDYELSGQIAAGLLHLCAPQGGRLLVLIPSLAMYGHRLRLRGLTGTLESEYPSIRLQECVELSSDEISDYRLTSRKLAEHPDTDLIICPGAFGTGCLTAMRDAGFFGRAKIIAYDCSRMINKALEERAVMAIIAQQPSLQGYTAMKTMFSILTGAGDIERDNYIKTRILLREHWKEISQRPRPSGQWQDGGEKV